MGAEYQHRAAPLPQPAAAVDRGVIDRDAALLVRAVELEIPDAVEMHALGTTRAMLSHMPAKMCSISAGDFSGKVTASCAFAV